MFDLTEQPGRKLTWRVEVREVRLKLYEIDCETEDEARANYAEGILIRDDMDYDDVEECKAIDVAEVDP